MTDAAQISCISKDPRYDRYNAITHVGGVFGGKQWKIPLEAAITHIETRRWEFYTLVNGHRQKVIIATRSGRKHLKTEADYDTPDNLLSLPECPR